MSALVATLLISSVEALSWAFRHSKSRLGTRLVLLALADFAQADGGEAYPSVATLAEMVGVSRRAARSSLRRLEEFTLAAAEAPPGSTDPPDLQHSLASPGELPSSGRPSG